MNVQEIKEKLAELKIEIPDGVTSKKDLLALVPDQDAPEAPEAPEQEASIQLCNLVSNGMSLSEARQFLYGESGQPPAIKADNVLPLNALGLPQGSPSNRDELLADFKARGKEQHPSTPTEKLVSLYESEILAD